MQRSRGGWVFPWIASAAVVVGCIGWSFVASYAWQETARTPRYVGEGGGAPSLIVLDGVEHLKMVDAFRGDASMPTVSPFNGHAVVPWVAHLLPLQSPAALALANAILIVVGLAALFELCASLRAPPATLWIVAAVACVWLPLIAAKGPFFVDIGTVGVLCLAVWAIFRMPLLAPVVFVVALLTKESSLVVLPAAITATVLAPMTVRRRGALLAAWLAATAAGLVGLALLRPSGSAQFAPWRPGSLSSALTMVSANLAPRGGWFLGLVSALIPVVVLIWALRWRHKVPAAVGRTVVVPLLVGIATVLALVTFSVLVASWDARLATTALPFTLPIIAVLAHGELTEPGWRSWRQITPRGFRIAVRAVASVSALVLLTGTLAIVRGDGLSGLHTDVEDRPAWGALQWDAFSEVAGSGDYVIEVPGGATADAYDIRFDSSSGGYLTVDGPDDTAGTADGSGRAPTPRLTGDSVRIPEGTTRIHITTDGDWVLQQA